MCLISSPLNSYNKVNPYNCPDQPLSSCSFSHMNLLCLSPPIIFIYLIPISRVRISIVNQILRQCTSYFLAHVFSFLKPLCLLRITYNSYHTSSILFIYSFTFHFNFNNLKKTSPLYIITQYHIQFLNQSCIKTYL